MSEHTILLSELKSNTQKLVQLNDDYKSKLVRKDGELQALQDELVTKNQEIVRLSNQVKLLESAGALAGEHPEGRKLAKLKINELVREIDRCIALLNR